MRKSAAGGLVYSTDGGRMCPVCRNPVADCVCAKKTQPAASGDGIVRVQRETKGRGGKAVTLVRGLALDPDALAALGKRLRSACGAGGTVKDGMLEVQGDHVERVMEWLTKEGWVVKRSGG
ncbi:MAG TPA: translation initiation factor Sui1 [Albitalea sp.]|nr:translation initiation factor Sui1 [Albitalea sp.]